MSTWKKIVHHTGTAAAGMLGGRVNGGVIDRHGGIFAELFTDLTPLLLQLRSSACRVKLRTQVRNDPRSGFSEGINNDHLSPVSSSKVPKVVGAHRSACGTYFRWFLKAEKENVPQTNRQQTDNNNHPPQKNASRV